MRLQLQILSYNYCVANAPLHNADLQVNAHVKTTTFLVVNFAGVVEMRTWDEDNCQNTSTTQEEVLDEDIDDLTL